MDKYKTYPPPLQTPLKHKSNLHGPRLIHQVHTTRKITAKHILTRGTQSPLLFPNMDSTSLSGPYKLASPRLSSRTGSTGPVVCIIISSLTQKEENSGTRNLTQYQHVSVDLLRQVQGRRASSYLSSRKQMAGEIFWILFYNKECPRNIKSTFSYTNKNYKILDQSKLSSSRPSVIRTTKLSNATRFLLLLKHYQENNPKSPR